MQPSQVKSATRALQVLEYFSLNQQRRSMSEIAADLGYPQSSATVLLKTLISMGYLNYDRKERVYFPTPKVTALGDWIPRALFGSGEVLAAMRDVHNATGEGIFLATCNDIYMQYAKTLESIHALRFHLDEGLIRPITQSAAGWVLLSAMPDDRLDNLVRRANIATPVAERVSTAAIQERIAQIRAQGYAHAEGVPLVGGATIAVLLPTRIQGQPTVLALGGIAERIRANFDAYLGALKDAAASSRAQDAFDVPIQLDP